MEPKDELDDSRIRIIGEPEQTPVFNCEALVGKAAGATKYVARAANLDGVQGEGGSERESLQKLIAEFKSTLADYTSRGEPIPWREPSQTAEPHEQTRLLAVHL